MWRDPNAAKDKRTLEQKIQDVLKPGSGATEGERRNARAALGRLRAAAGTPKARPTVTREAVEAAPAETHAPEGVAVRYPNGQWVHYDAQDAPWEWIETAGLRWRWESDRTERRGAPGSSGPYKEYWDARTRKQAEEEFKRAAKEEPAAWADVWSMREGVLYHNGKPVPGQQPDGTAFDFIIFDEYKDADEEASEDLKKIYEKATGKKWTGRASF